MLKILSESILDNLILADVLEHTDIDNILKDIEKAGMDLVRYGEGLQTDIGFDDETKEVLWEGLQQGA